MTDPDKAKELEDIVAGHGGLDFMSKQAENKKKECDKHLKNLTQAASFIIRMAAETEEAAEHASNLFIAKQYMGEMSKTMFELTNIAFNVAKEVTSD